MPAARIQEGAGCRKLAGFLAAIKREGLTDKILENDRVCSRHFITGKPATLEDDMHPDWLPTQHLPGSSQDDSGTPPSDKVDRYERMKRRQEQRKQLDEVAVNLTHELEEQGTGDTSSNLQTEAVSTAGVQTELSRHHILLFQQELIEANDKIRKLEGLLKATHLQFTAEDTRLTNDSFVQFHTGLPNAAMLNALYEFVTPKHLQSSTTSKLTPFQELMLTLIKLRLNSPMQDLAYRFSIHCSTVSRIFKKWVVILDTRLKPLLLWPERDDLRRTMPECFRAKFNDKVAVIIDCFEVFIERSSGLLTRSATWSTYKHHNTAKFLIGIAPQGVVSFISQAWGGRVSDKYLTEHCGILTKLLPGDIVLADRGFDITDSVGICQATLHTPAFTKGKAQLTALEVEKTRSIANVRIHVERVIGIVRQKYTILQGTLPIDYVSTRAGEECLVLDRIVRISCALCNLCDSVVPFD